MRKYHRDYIMGLISGIVIHFINCCILEIPYFSLISKSFGKIYIPLVAIGSFFIIYILLKGKPSTISMIARFTTFLLVYGLVWTIIGSLQLLPIVNQLLGLQTGAFSDGVSGLMSLFFVATVLFVSIITIVTRVIILKIQALKHK